MHAVIFDMDGVIVDSEIHWKSLEGFFLKSLVPTWTDQDQGRIIGLSINDTYALLSGEYGLQKSREEFFALYQEIAREIYGQKAALIEGFHELLLLLKEKGVPLALASSSRKNWIDLLLDRYELKRYFDVIVSAEDLPGGQGKPSPAIYLHTAKLLGVPPEKCIVIEDSRNGVLSAKNAGMYCIGFRNGFNEEQDLSGADTIVNGYKELDSTVLLGALQDNHA